MLVFRRELGRFDRDRGLSLPWVKGLPFAVTCLRDHIRSTVMVHNEDLVSKARDPQMERSRNGLTAPMGTWPWGSVFFAPITPYRSLVSSGI